MPTLLGPVAAAGRVKLRMWSPSTPERPLEMTVHRCIGENSIRDIVPGWSANAYGWVLQWTTRYLGAIPCPDCKPPTVCCVQ